MQQDIKRIAKNMINSYSDFDIESKEDPNNPLSLHHLRWMLETIISSDYSDTKMSRWLGYIQGAYAYKKPNETESLLDFDRATSKIKDYQDKTTSHLVIVNDYLSGQFDGFNHDDFDFGNYNLLFLLNVIKQEHMDSVEANRLLGFIQGILVCKGLLDVEQERNRTRKIFNGE